MVQLANPTESTGGGAFFRPPKGQYLGKFVGLVDAPPDTMYPNKDGTPKQRVSFRWELYTLDQRPVPDKEGNIPAIVDRWCSTSMYLGPQNKSTAVEILEGMLGRSVKSHEKSADLVEECTGEWCILYYEEDPKNPAVGRLKTVLPHRG